MIEGLKLTFTGEELHTLLAQRMEEHERSAARWKREQVRTPEEQTDEEPVLAGRLCGNEAERHEWRVDVLGFIRDHIDASEIYRLGPTDLEFAELLPEEPGWMEQDEYEERTSAGFNLPQLTKGVGGIVPPIYGVLDRSPASEE